MEPAARTVVAVTGATGFVGQWILRHLTEAGYQVRALTRRAQSSEAVTWIPGSLEDEAALETLIEGADAVIHCAGAIKARSRDEFFDINAGGTRRLAGLASAKVKPPRLILLSSIAAREPQLSSYAASKRAAEQVLRAFTPRLPVVILRPPAVYGPGDMETLRIFKLVEQGLFIAPLSEGKVSLIHADDLARAVVRALQAGDIPAAPVEFDDGKPGGYTWPEIAQTAGAAVGKTPRIVRLPGFALYMIGSLGSLASVLTRSPSVVSFEKMREFLHPDWVAAGAGAEGFKPLWDIEKGFADAVKWYASRGLLKSNREVDLSP